MKNIEYVKESKDREQMIRVVAEMVILELQLKALREIVEKRDRGRYRLHYEVLQDEYANFARRRANFNSKEGVVYRALNQFDPEFEYGFEENIKTINEKVKEGLRDARESIHLYRSVIQSDYALLEEHDFTPQQKRDWEQARAGEYLFDPTIPTEEVIRRLAMWSKVMSPKVMSPEGIPEGIPTLKALEEAYDRYISASVLSRKAAKQVLMNCFYALELDKQSIGPLMKSFDPENLKTSAQKFLWSFIEGEQIRAVMSYPKDFQKMLDFAINNLDKMSTAQCDQIVSAMKRLEASEAPFKKLLRLGITRDEWEHVDETLKKLDKEITSAEMDLDDIESEPEKLKAQRYIDYLERKEAALEEFKAMQELHEKLQGAAKSFVDVVKGIQLRMPEPLSEKPLSLPEILKKLNQFGRAISEADLPTLESLSDDLKKYQECIKGQSPLSEDTQKKIIARIASMQEKIEERINEIPLIIHH